MWGYLLVGLAVGTLLTIPVAATWSRRTERRVRRLEQRARTAERLAEMGTMTRGLAHEIKNPLSTVGLNIQLLREDLEEMADHAPPDALSSELLGSIRRRFESLGRETQRLRDILEDFLRFAGRMELDRTPTDLNSLVDELADFYEPQAAAAKVNLRRQLDPRLSPDRIEAIQVDGGLLKQALLNLLINATQAMTDARANGAAHGGADELIVRTEFRRAGGGMDADHDEALIHIIDTGPGIPAQAADKIFQPYFSTKRGGTGLGLATARRIVEEHGGQLTVHSDPGRGTDFTIALPLSASAN